MGEQQTFTVVGAFDEDGSDGFAATFEAESAAEADLECSGSYVAIVLAGAHQLNPETVFEEPVAWTVPGWYKQNFQRYAGGVSACSAAEAVAEAFEQAIEDNLWQYESREDAIDDLDLVLVGAVLGEGQCADVYACDEYWALPADERPSWCEFDYGIELENDEDDEE